MSDDNVVKGVIARLLKMSQDTIDSIAPYADTFGITVFEKLGKDKVDINPDPEPQQDVEPEPDNEDHFWDERTAVDDHHQMNLDFGENDFSLEDVYQSLREAGEVKRDQDADKALVNEYLSDDAVDPFDQAKIVKVWSSDDVEHTNGEEWVRFMQIEQTLFNLDAYYNCHIVRVGAFRHWTITQYVKD